MPEIGFLLGVPNLVYKTFIIKRNFLTLHCPTQLPAIGNSHNIGIESNVPDGLYVVLQDSAGNSAVIKHPDPAATTIGSWTEWDIPLIDFSSATGTGVNLQAIKSMVIGVGDRTNPQRGGAGTLYIDDIGLRLP